jgi:hypothetical protein
MEVLPAAYPSIYTLAIEAVSKHAKHYVISRSASDAGSSSGAGSDDDHKHRAHNGRYESAAHVAKNRHHNSRENRRTSRENRRNILHRHSDENIAHESQERHQSHEHHHVHDVLRDVALEFLSAVSWHPGSRATLIVHGCVDALLAYLPVDQPYELDEAALLVCVRVCVFICMCLHIYTYTQTI